MRNLILNIFVILHCAFGIACGFALLVRRITAIFSAIISHICAVLSSWRAGIQRPESRGLPEIFVGVSGGISGFLGFLDLVYNVAEMSSSKFGCAELGQSKARPAAKYAAHMCPQRMLIADNPPPVF